MSSGTSKQRRGADLLEEMSVEESGCLPLRTPSSVHCAGATVGAKRVNGRGGAKAKAGNGMYSSGVVCSQI
jgi:hypothetical protein